MIIVYIDIPIIDVWGEGWGRHELAGALGDLHLPLLHYYPTSCDDPLSNTVHLERKVKFEVKIVRPSYKAKVERSR